MTELPYTKDDLARAINDGLVTERTSPGGTLVIANYTKAAQRTPGAFNNPAVRHSRGLITDAATGEVVARGMSKFFNHNEPGADRFEPDERVMVVDKIDGVLGIAYPGEDGKPAIATRGSFTSEYAQHATAVLRERHAESLDAITAMLEDGFTPLFEIVYPGSRIVIDYRGIDDLILIGGVRNDTGEGISPWLAESLLEWPGMVAKVLAPNMRYEDAVELRPRENAEGVVLRRTDEKGVRMVKVKQADYVERHRIVTGLTERTVWEHWAAQKPVSDLLADVPEELWPWVARVWTTLEEKSSFLHTLVGLEVYLTIEKCGDGPENRKLAAEFIKEEAFDPILTFLGLDGKLDELSEAIARRLKPGATKPVTKSEAA